MRTKAINRVLQVVRWLQATARYILSELELSDLDQRHYYCWLSIVRNSLVELLIASTAAEWLHQTKIFDPSFSGFSSILSRCPKLSDGGAPALQLG
jgi:hypothetical protein